MIGILPASGGATRLGGIPKFALPYNDRATTLLEKHITLMKPFAQRIIVVTRARWVPLVSEIDQDITILIREPSTMSDAVKFVSNKFYSNNYLVGMPDTFFLGANPYLKLFELSSDIEIGLACWEITEELKGRVGQVDFDCTTGIVHKMEDKKYDCQFGYMWGAMRLSNEIMGKIQVENPHPGIDVANLITDHGKVTRATLIPGKYFDVGTMSGYRDLLNSQNEQFSFP